MTSEKESPQSSLGDSMRDLESGEQQQQQQQQEDELHQPGEKLTPTLSLGASLHEVESNPYGSRPACFRNTTQECIFVLTTTLAIGQVSIFQGLVLCINAHIARDLNMNAAEVTWISAAQALSSGCFLLLFGRVADLFGRRRLFLISMASFTACLLITGFATNAIYMDVFCGIMGLCSAAAVPPAMGTLGAVYNKPSRRKNRAFACFSAGNPLGYVTGMLIAGITTKITTWRAAFWVLAVVYVAFTVAAWWIMPEDEEDTKGKFNRETLAKFDLLGTFLAVAGIGMFTGAMTLAADAPHGWKTSYVIALLVLGVVFIAAFVYWQSIFSHPLMPLSIWRDRNFTLLITTLCLGFYGFANNIFWLSLFWQRVQGVAPLSVAVRLLPQAIGGVIINVIAALVMHRVSNKLLMTIGAVAWAVSPALLCAMKETSIYWAFAFPALLLSVVGADFEFTVTNMYVMSSLPSSQQSVASGLLNTMTRLSMSVGLGVSTAAYGSFVTTTANNGHTTTVVPFRAYQSTWWVGLAGGGLGLMSVAFVTLKAQGGRQKTTANNDNREKIDEK